MGVMIKKASKRERPGVKMMGVEIELEDYEKLKQIAEADQRSLGDLVRRALKIWLYSADAEELAKPLATRLAETGPAGPNYLAERGLINKNEFAKLQAAVAELEAGMKVLKGNPAKHVEREEE
jgi:hypothetical protein